MNKAVKYFLMTFVLISAYNCSDESNLTSINDSDLLLENSLVGKWQFGSHIRTFEEDGTYIDSIFAHPYPWPEGGLDSLDVCTKIDSNGYFADRVVYGRYQVKDGILKMQPVYYLVDCNPLQAPASYIYYDQFVGLSGDSLSLTKFYSWEITDDNTHDIWGSWESSYWVWAYHEELPIIGAPQLVTETITFFEDSTVCHNKMVGLPYAGKVWRSSFTYEAPLLTIVIGYQKYNVTFDNNKMHWLNKNFTYYWLRLQS